MTTAQVQRKTDRNVLNDTIIEGGKIGSMIAIINLSTHSLLNKSPYQPISPTRGGAIIALGALAGAAYNVWCGIMWKGIPKQQ